MSLSCKIIIILSHYLIHLDLTLAALTPDDINCSFEKDFCNWYPPSYSNRQWTRGKDSLSLQGSGPMKAKVGEYYAFFDTRDPNMQEGATAYLVSPNITQKPPPGSCLQFYLHMYGTTMGKFMYGLEKYQDPSAEYIIEFDHGNVWYCFVLNLKNAEIGDSIFFAAIRGNGAQSVIAIDNITLFTGVAKCNECEDLENGIAVLTTLPSTTQTTMSTTPNSTAEKSSTSSEQTITSTDGNQPIDVLPIVFGVLLAVMFAMATAFVVLFLICRRRWIQSSRTSQPSHQHNERISNHMKISRKFSKDSPYSFFPNSKRRGKNTFDNDEQGNLKSIKSETTINEYDLPDENIYSEVDIEKETDCDGGYLHAKMSESNFQKDDSNCYLHPESTRDSTTPIANSSESNDIIAELHSEPVNGGYTYAEGERPSSECDVPKFTLSDETLSECDSTAPIVNNCDLSDNTINDKNANLNFESTEGEYLHAESQRSSLEDDVPHFTLLDETCDDSTLDLTSEFQMDDFSYAQNQDNEI